MKKYYQKIWAIFLTLVMVCSTVTVSYKVDAADINSAPMTTESIDDPVEPTENAEVYFVSAATGKLITLDGIRDNPIDCKQFYDKDSVPKNGLFTIYYAIWNDREVVNFTNTATETSWKADGSKVFQIAKRTNPSGWESVRMQAVGEGNIAFQTNANEKYFTVQDDKLELVELKENEQLSSNERFIAYTDTKPKTAKKVTLSNISGDDITVSWEGVNECIYCGYEVLYSTEENGTYQSAGRTEKTSLQVNDLDLNTTYYFKVRTLTNYQGGVYADSKIAYATTLKDHKPSRVTGIEAKETDGKIVLDWKEAANAGHYKIYRAVSRFAEYQEIGETDSNTFTDHVPNSSSKYQNYHKVQAVNDSNEGELSAPASLEISMFGNNMYIFNETDNQDQMDATIEKIFDGQHYNQFGEERYTLAYKPGDYTGASDVNMGYYTQLLGLGKTPYDVKIRNVRTPAALSKNNATCNFWVGIENVTIADLDNNDDVYFSFQWGVSQAAPARRLYVERKASFDWYSGWASGGFVADCYFEKSAGSYSQQQYYYRNCYINGGVYGVNWNQLIQGCEGINGNNSKDNTGKPFSNAVALLQNNGVTNWDQRGCTTMIDNTPVIREKPFLYFDAAEDEYKVFVPAMRKDAKGVSWSRENMGEGTSISVDKYFYVARPDRDTAATINKQLRLGKNIIFSPGVYHAEEAIHVTKANTVLLGLGQATIIPDNEEAAIVTEDVGGLAVCGLILDAGNHSKTLLTVGKEGCNRDHSDNPTVLQDVIYRVGGTGHLGRCDSCQVINSNHVIIDHTWIWRADHGDNTGWYKNTSDNGLIVNGDDVTSYGLFCEHFQKYDIIWRGERGSTYFLQNEKCYDPQSQESWMSHDGEKKGYAAYKVANNVKEHYAVALGVYDVFINTNGASIYLDNAIEVPDSEKVLIENACIVEIANGAGPKVGINHIVNGTTDGIRTGEGNNGGYALQRLLNYRNNQSISLPDYYVNQEDTHPQTEAGIPPTNDVQAEKDIVKEEMKKEEEIPLWEMTEEDYDEKIAEGEREEDKNNPPAQEELPTNPGNVENPTNTENPTTGENGNAADSTEFQKNPENKTDSNEAGDGGDFSKTPLKVGTKFTAGKYCYRILTVKGKKGTVVLISVKNSSKKKLKKAVIGATVTYQGYRFKITKIGKSAFKKCKKLKTLTIGKNVIEIEKKAFYYNRALKKITVKGKKLQKIGKKSVLQNKKEIAN